MKPAECSRCGTRIMVRDDFDPYEDMSLCVDCDEDMAGVYETRLNGEQ